nr:EOG090X0GIP [Sida crystallina]
MESLYHTSQKILVDIQLILPHVERSSGKEAIEIDQNIREKLEEITSNIQRLDILVNKELPVRRREARLKVDQLKQDRLLLQNAIYDLQRKRVQREQEAQAREELLSQTFRPNNRETTLNIDHSLEHHTALNRIHRSLDDVFDTGSAVLDGLRSQRNVLKKAHRRLLDVTNMMNLSNTVMRMIERRSSQDKFIFYACAIVTCLVIMWAFWYFRH